MSHFLTVVESILFPLCGGNFLFVCQRDLYSISLFIGITAGGQKSVMFLRKEWHSLSPYISILRESLHFSMSGRPFTSKLFAKPRLFANQQEVPELSEENLPVLYLRTYTLIEFDDDDGMDFPVLAASLEDGGPPGLLLAEALDVGLGPMVLP